MAGADLRQSDVKEPLTSDLSLLSFLIAALTSSGVMRSIVYLDFSVLSATVELIVLIRVGDMSCCSLQKDSHKWL
jgi:hypothetical protein